jgi:hypothetical protein
MSSLGREQVRGGSLRLVKAPFGITDLKAVDDDSLINTDGEPADRVDASPHLVFERRSARTEVRQGDKYSTATFTTLGKIHAYRLLS